MVQLYERRSFATAAPVPEATWVVIAAFNEGLRIGAVLDSLLAVAHHVVVVDDGSSDETRAVALTRPVWLVSHAANLGQGASLQTGLDFALGRGAEFLVTFDADGQHQPEDIPCLVSALQQSGADFALGSRFTGMVEGMPISRRILLKMAVWFTRVLSGVKLTDAHNGLRAMTRRGAQHIAITFNRMEHASEIIDQIARSRLKHVEVPVHIRYTAESLAKGQRTSAAVGLAARILLNRIVR
jgi:polyprenyl-phospho-N-acetylgalactosaminyl synthase